jgi:Circularly permutated YpsA SLOG family
MGADPVCLIRHARLRRSLIHRGTTGHRDKTPLVATINRHSHPATSGNLARENRLVRTRIARIVTGGQSGVDRAASDVAIEFGIPYGGWVPRGGWAEDFPTPPGLLAVYGSFQECPSEDPAERTARNVLDSDATLVLIPAAVRSPGSSLAYDLASGAGRVVAVVDPFAPDALTQLEAFASALPHRGALNVAGPRASQCPDIYEAVRALLRAGADALFSIP